MCDGIAEHICVRLCRYYLEHFGRILHHNVDKILLLGGAAKPSFSGGDVVEPIEIYLAGRATEGYRGKRIPTHEIAGEACRGWLSRHVRGLDIDRGVRIHLRMRPGAADLVRLVDPDDAIPLANDTSCGAGFASLTDLERVVLEVERLLNSQETKRSNPEIGEDVQVMGIRRGTRIDLTIACAFIGRFVCSPDDYTDKKHGAIALKAARRLVGKLYNLAASRMSATIAARVPHVSSAECVLVSQIGRPPSEPRVVDVCLAGDHHVLAAVASKSVSQFVRSELERLADLRDALLVQVY